MTRVFVSYARADGSNAALSVQEELESGGFEVWRDRRNLDAFNDYSVEIERAIERADVIVVCVTASITQSLESFVRREVLFAQSKRKLIVPIRIDGATVPILIIHLTWIDALAVSSLAGTLAPELRRRLEAHSTSKLPEVVPLASVAFVRGLLDDIVDYLESTTAVLLDVTASGTAKAPGRPRGGLPGSMQPLRHTRQQRTLTAGALGQTLAVERERIVLHGGSGSGKTTSLLVAAREAANAWLEDNRRRLPVFCRAADWRASDDESLLVWLHRSAPLLPIVDLQAALSAGLITLFIDGLDELGSKLVRNQDVIDPRRDLLTRLPASASVLLAMRSEAFEEIGEPDGFGVLEMAAITDEQVGEYLAGDSKLAGLLEAEPSLRDLARTPLSLGLLHFVANAGEVQVEDRPEVGELTARLRVVNSFTLSRWQHEKDRGSDVAPVRELTGVLGRVATRNGQVFKEGDVREAAEADDARAASVVQTAAQLGIVRAERDGQLAFFHPSFADYYATVHCRRYLGSQSPDGWDTRLFDRIGQLGDPSFIPALQAMAAAGGFWRGEFGGDIAEALNTIGGSDDPRVVNTLLHLAGYSGLGREGLAAIGDFARRCEDDLKTQFADRLSELAETDPEAVHQLVGLGEPGVEGLLRAHARLDKDAPMRRQIESYSVVRRRLGLPSA